MYTSKANSTLASANRFYEEVQNELARPDRDVVPYRVCQSAYKAIVKYLTAYVLFHGTVLDTSVTIPDILKQCRRLNAGFNDIDLEIINSHDEPKNEWMDKNTMLAYYKKATMTREMVNKYYLV